MSTALRKPISLEEFLAWEERQELRYEFDGYAVQAMTGATYRHGAIQANLLGNLFNRLRGKPCRPMGSDVKLLVSGSVRYPDAFVTCRPVQPDATVVTEPVVVFEILNPSTSAKDFGIKNEEYRDTPSIQRYVLLEQERQGAVVFARADGDWAGHIVSGNAILAMPEIGIEIPLADLYEGVAFEESDPPS